MAGRIRGLSISLDMDGSRVERSLAQIRRSFRDFNSSLKTNMNNFRYSEKSVESYQRIVKELDNTIKGQRKNVNDLKRQFDNLSDAEKTNTIKGSQLRQEYNKQADALNMYEAELRDFTQELKKMQREQEIANSKWGRIGSHLDSTGRKFTSLGEKMRSVGTGMTLGVTMPTVALGTAAIKAAGEYDAASSQFKQVFGSLESQAQDKLNSIAKTTGLLPNSLRGSYTMMAAYAKTTGMDTKSAMDLTSRATLAAADSAAFYDRSIEEVTESLQSYLKGNYENDAALGISSTETTRNAAANKLYGKSFNDLSEEQKQLTLLQMVEDGNKLSGALGQAARESDQLGTQTSNLKTAFKDFLAELGKPILPLAIKLLKALSGATKILTGWFSNLNPVFQTFVLALMAVAAALGPIITTFGILAVSIGSIMTLMAPLATAIAEAGGVAAFLSSGFSTLGAAIAGISWPIVGIIAAIAALGAGFVIAYKKSETFRNVVNKAINGVKQAFVTAGNIIKGFFQLFKNTGEQGVITLEKILPRGVAEGLLAFAKTTKSVFKAVVTAVFNFGKQIGDKLKTFWDQNGAEITQAVKNIGTVIKTIFQFVIWPVISFVMKSIWNIMKLIWPLVKAIIVDTWNNIKTIISGALNIILGTVKIFSALFTGNWKGVWQGIKTVAKGALQLIWGIFNLWFVGKILKVVKIFGGFFKKTIKLTFTGVKNIITTIVKAIYNVVKAIFGKLASVTKSIFSGLKKWLTNTWKSIKNSVVNLAKGIYDGVNKFFKNTYSATKKIFSRLKTWLVNTWKSIKKNVTDLAKGLYSNVKKFFTNIWESVKKITTRLRDWLIKTWKSIKNKISGIVNSLYKAIKKYFSNIWDNTKRVFSKLKDWLIKVWNTIKNKVSSIVEKLRSAIKRTFDKLYNGTRNTFSKLKNWLIDTWQKIKDKLVSFSRTIKDKVLGNFNGMKNSLKTVIGKITDLINKMVRGVKTGLNKLIGGVNWVGEKLGMGKQMIKPIKLSTGTAKSSNYVSNGKINQDTMAIVGDKGKGNGSGGFRHETITYPNGKSVITPATDTLAFLPKGSTVHNGAQTQSALSNNFLPKFSTGTFGSDLLKRARKHKKGDSLVGDALTKTKDGIKAVSGKVVEGGKAVIDNTLSAAAKGKDWLKDKIGDVLDWIDKPGKLLDKVFEGFGFNLDALGISKAAEIPYKLMKGMMKPLKDAAVNKVKEWLEEAGGGDGGYIDLSKGINFGFARTAAEARAHGYPFNRPHHGLDINYKHDKVYSTMSGTATATTGWGGGFGNHVEITNGNLKSIYGHLHKLAFHGTKKVRPGTFLGISGGSPAEDGQGAGSSTGLHLHYEMQRNGQPFDPTNWLKTHNGGGSKSKSASAWKSDIRRAAKAIGVSVSSGDINDVARLIQTESGGNAGVTQQIHDQNSGGNEAQGLLQYTPGSFNAYAIRGHKNIKNGYDQLLAFFNNTDWRANLSYWKRRMASGLTGWGPTGRRRKYATGGLIRNAGWYNIAEGGYPEWVIPTDPRRKSEAMNMIALAANEIEGNGTGGNLRPHNLPRVSGNSDSKLEQKLDLLISLMSQVVDTNNVIAEKDFSPSIDKYSHKREVINVIDEYTRLKARRNKF